MGDMVMLANAERSQGKKPELKDLYEKAAWANPATREKILAAEKQTEEEKRKAEARAKSAQAKKASKMIKGNSGHSPSSDLDLRAELESHF